MYTTKKIKIKNLSKTRVKYVVDVPEKYYDEVHFEPNEKELEANETFEVVCYFTPREKRTYKIKVPITVW